MKKYVMGFWLLGLGTGVGLAPLWALNNIYFNSYNLTPKSVRSDGFHLSTGLYLNPEDMSSFDVPVCGILGLTGDFEIGAGLWSHWGEGDVISHFFIGSKFELSRGTTLQGDLVLGSGAGRNGFSLTYLKRNRFASILTNYTSFKLGLFEYFTDNSLIAFEAAFYPTLDLIDPLWFRMGFVGSSQTNDFEDHLAMDLLPTVIVGLKGGAEMHLGLILGLAGDRKSGTALQTVLEIPF